jgi:hypothetical protein
MALRTRDLEAANAIKDEIGKLRKAGLDRAGEFSVENMVFKELRRDGTIEEIIDTLADLYSKIYSK